MPAERGVDGAARGDDESREPPARASVSRGMRKNTSKILLGLTAAMGVACGGAPAAQGSLDDALIGRVVRAHSPEIEACYATALERDAEANGSCSSRSRSGPRAR